MSKRADHTRADLVCLESFIQIIVRNRDKRLFVVNIRHMQITLVLFGVQHSDIVKCDRILATSRILAAAFQLFHEDVILLTVDVDLISDYRSKEFVNSRKTD